MKLKEYLKKQRLSVQLFADICGLSRVTIHHYLKGTRIPSLEAAFIIHSNTSGVVSFMDLLPLNVKNKYARS